MSKDKVEKVLVVGGGIAGLVVASALGQRGVQVDVAEVKPEQSVYGVGIIQPGNALRALASIGVMDDCLAAGYQSDVFRYFDADENMLATLNMLRVADPNRPAVNFLMRAELQRILTASALRAGARLQLGVTIEALHDTGDHVDVTLTDGSTGRYDLVIGADGIRSTVRQRLFGSHEPRYTGHGCWRFTTQRPKDLTYQALYFGVGIKAGLVPLSDELMYLLVVSTEPGNPRMPKDQLHELLLDRMAPFNGPMLSQVRERLQERIRGHSRASLDDVIYVPIEEIILDRPWHKGRTVLIGDAAHASSPHIAQGAAMAIEDAVVLAQETAKQGDIESLLAAYEERRYARCRFVQDLARKTGEEGQLSDPARLPRTQRAAPQGICHRCSATSAARVGTPAADLNTTSQGETTWP